MHVMVILLLPVFQVWSLRKHLVHKLYKKQLPIPESQDKSDENQ